MELRDPFRPPLSWIPIPPILSVTTVSLPRFLINSCQLKKFKPERVLVDSRNYIRDISIIAMFAIAFVFVSLNMHGSQPRALAGQAATQEASLVTGVWAYSDSLASLQAGAGSYNHAWPEWYGLSPSSGDLQVYSSADDAGMLQAMGSARLLPTIGYSKSRQGDPTFMLDSDKRQASVDQIVARVMTNGYAGISLDIEGLSISYENAFSAYVTRLADELHAQGKLLGVALQPKWGPTRSDGSLWNFQDWTVIGNKADYAQIMLYGWVGNDDPPGPMSPFYWVDGIL